ncbi:Long-chain-fatty-acid--CoA ligase [Rhodobacteraceae bacterium THAF1]|uniref:AMP-binding protein n=1 Tax=Palleronia sp. THAF1 TaxID=2587842 RepID=UPI000F3BDB72|nr:AMP-binding protein [Palleronia sp. THAF1]QFU09716.1 Long-chain-fatty-acid--CoA ligase [Palleronia sp. THAF1]VDC17381.1 Long-chain-fatty-acid--CoA ligase [Rhodobacteraceae bacterium THAF1]
MTVFKSPHPDIDIPDISITERLFQGLEMDPDGVVLTDGTSGAGMTAAALQDRIKRLAGGLTQRGLGKGGVVALMAPNIPDYVTVFHGVAWAGGTVTTINPTYTAYEVRKQLLDSKAKILVVVAGFADTAREAIQGTSVETIAVIGAGETTLEDLLGDPLQAQADVDLEKDIVVLPYSSGTTGMPKGVMLSHRNLVANVEQCAAFFDPQVGETTIAFLPFFHIYGMTVLMNQYLARGARLVTMPRFDLERFLSLVAEHKPKVLYIVPPVALALAKHPMVDQFDHSSVDRVMCGAAPLGGELGDACAARMGGVMTQGYGMTELSPVSHVTPIDNPRAGASGLTVPNCESRVVDPDTLEDRAPGEEGELWVRGPNVMQGYLGNDAATKETITEDGWLRTGDLCVIDEDGYMFVRERVKELIKYKGFQVAPAELEAELVGHDAIQDAAVMGKPDDEAGEVPIAFIVKSGEIDEAGVKAHISGRLSTYKQLHEVHFVDEIPKSASGKILRRVLKDQYVG